METCKACRWHWGNMQKAKMCAVVMLAMALAGCGKTPKSEKIRPDIDAYIEQAFDTKKKRTMARQYAKAAKSLLEAPTDDLSAELIRKYTKAYLCINWNLGASQTLEIMLALDGVVARTAQEQKSLRGRISTSRRKFHAAGIPPVSNESYCE